MWSKTHSVQAVRLLIVYLHACRALAVCAVITGFFGGVLTLIGMKCTKIGGSELANSRVTFAGAVTYLASGKSKVISLRFFCQVMPFSQMSLLLVFKQGFVG